ncbi:MAG: hypothetical protein ACK58T_37625, partial [Phycisphaerae bacterium]
QSISTIDSHDQLSEVHSQQILRAITVEISTENRRHRKITAWSPETRNAGSADSANPDAVRSRQQLRLPKP